MTYLGLGQKPIIMNHYPHFLAEDVAVWSKFLAKMGKVIEQVWYDLHVGKPLEFPERPTEAMRKVAEGVSRKRIDVVCKVGSEFWVVEVKPFANMLALGQVFSYTRLFEAEYSVSGRVRPVVVCDEFDEDLREQYAALSVMVFVNEKS